MLTERPKWKFLSPGSLSGWPPGEKSHDEALRVSSRAPSYPCCHQNSRQIVKSVKKNSNIKLSKGVHKTPFLFSDALTKCTDQGA